MSSLLDSSGNAIRDLDATAIRPRFGKLARHIAAGAGRPAAFGVATGLVLLWAATGPIFNYSDTWQLVINTSTTIITFLMVFVIQNTQNRDTAAIQIKLDELIRATKDAQNAILDLEQLDEQELTLYLKRYERLAAEAKEKLRSGRSEPEVLETKQ